MQQPTKKFLENIINGSSCAIFVKDSNLKFILINDAFTKMTGLREQDILGKDDFDFFPPSKAEFFKVIDEEVLNSGNENSNEEKLLDSNGETLTLNTIKSRTQDEEGNFYIVGNIYDTTEKAKLISELKISN